jgi:hypothetical protein
MNGSNIPQGTPHLFSATVTSGGASFLYANGTQTGSNTSTPALYATGGTLGLGAYLYLANPEAYFSGRINEIVLFNRVLTQSDRQRLEGYLAWKWGLQSRLPTTHPYYKINPS